MENIPVFSTYIHPGAGEAVSKLLLSTFISEGEVVKDFEKKLEADMGLKNCVTVNSGTSALHLALVLAGIKEGDEVILPAQTFVATGLVILQQKAKPVFADIELSTGNISVESIRSKITAKTKAIIPVHWGGYPCDMDAINALAAQHNILVIEDAAHAIGARYKDKPVGTLSDFTCFSFQAIKHLTTGDGGAVCTKDDSAFQKAMTLRWFGIDRATTSVGELGERDYNITEPGYKYHLNNYAAALGLANLQGLQERFKRRLAIAERYRNELGNTSGIRLFGYEKDRQCAYWLFGFHVEKRSEFIRMMKAAGITASVIHQRIDRNAVFGGLDRGLVNQEAFDKSQIHIPIHDNLSDSQVDKIINTVNKGW